MVRFGEYSVRVVNELTAGRRGLYVMTAWW